ncbi:lethal(2) giant larvae protein isoform X2 [Atheta coriaria]|uniref:lethal(2) giant larvae protein isoform X2 n=1 Tax=Dalotia coriaria TaxID=877792 RepID=UPI0031F414E3
MFKFIKPKGPHVTVERQKLQKELFSYRRTLQHGFPNKPTAMAWDPTLRLLCVGTASGAIKVFGKPGVEFYGQHADNVAVTKITFLPNAGRVVSLCEDNSLHLWEVNKNSLVQVKSHSMEGKLKQISALCVDSKAENLLLGTEGGNIYVLELNSFVMSQEIIYQDVVLQNASHKLNPGAVEVLAERPGEPDHLLIAYNRGLVVLLNRKDFSVEKKYTPSQQLESVYWHRDGQSFTTSHNDGSHTTWHVDHENPVAGPTTDYGPFACKAILKIERYELKGEPLIVFSGGLPRANYGERFNVTVMNGDKHVAFEFTSKVIDFVVITAADKDDSDGEANGDVAAGDPEALIVLAEEELVAIDLQSDDWLMMNLPYMVPVHASAITCSQYVSGVPDDLWNQLKDAGKAQTKHLYSSRAWPIDGGELLCSKGEQPRREMLLTGHEDGTVRFWDAGTVNLTPIYKFSTSQFFTGEDMHDEDLNNEDEEDWPPFKKIGVFDPYTDDPRFAVKRVVLCPLSGTLVVAGTAGHVVVAKFDTEMLMEEVRISTMNLVGERDSFVWKGHSELAPRKGEITQKRGFQATSILQIYPPAAVTCCTLHADWGLVAAGTSHGLALYDYVKHKPVTVKCTLNPNDLNGAGDAPISRRKSFKKSLRESFRRLRKGRSQRRTSNTTTNTTTSPPVRRLPASTDEPSNPLEAKPVERQIEARTTDDGMGSIVRCLYFARTFLINVQNTVPTLWAGTNAGAVYVFTINVPSGSKRNTDDVTCQLGKEIQLKHRAPVIAIAVLDSSSRPLPEPLEVEKGISPLPETTQPHRVIIASEEQFKIFTLPALKPFGKYKLTAHEGARVRRMSFANFSCNLPDSNDVHNEVDLLCLTNIGDCFVLTLPDLKRQLNAVVVRKEDINGISSLIFTKEAEALYLHSSSELQRLSLATRRVTSARCYLSLPEAVKEEPEAETPSEIDEVDEEREKEAPLVNGNSIDSKENSVGDKMENGETDTIHNSTMNSTMTSSIGDITIDSVKDHINAHDDLNARMSGITITKTTITTSMLNQSGEVVTNTTTTTTTTEHPDDD